MLTTIEGIYRNGKVELLEPASVADGSRVVVTFLSSRAQIDLQERGIDEQQAADLRKRIGGVASDWERSEMDVYDEA